MAKGSNSETGATVPADSQPRYRSGAVARMLRMPVATLRTWERRFHACEPSIAPSGHRFYSGQDVRKLALLKQLTDLGHAIGSISALDLEGLQRLASTHASTLVDAQRQAPDRAPLRAAPARAAVVGPALADRLKVAEISRRLDGVLDPVGHFETLDACLETTASPPFELGIDLLIVHVSCIDELPLTRLREAVDKSRAQKVAVLCGAPAEPAGRQAPWDALVSLRHEPLSDDGLAGWLAELGASTKAARSDPARFATWPWAIAAPTPRRFDDATLRDLAGLSTTVACECPRHVAELLMQLANFEAYSAQCVNLSPDDAALHATLQNAAGAARAIFEVALEHVAQHEGLLLPG